MESRILAIDIGTSSTKGLLIDTAGDIHGIHTVHYALSTPAPGLAEQDPDEILAAVRQAITKLGEGGVPLVFSSVMHSLLALDGSGRPLTPVWTWADRRCAAEAAELRGSDLASGLHQRNGTPLHPMSPLCKLIYMHRHQREVFGAAERFVSIKEYVIEQLTGERYVDHSVASSTGLFDVAQLEWDVEALELAGVSTAQLSEPMPTTHVIRGERDIVLGATDGVLANLGVGAVGKDSPCITLGTSGAARLVVTEPATDPTGRLFCYLLDEGRWVIGAAINNGGLVLRWMKETFCGADWDDEAVLAAAAAAPRGGDGLLFVPALTGDRYPSYRADVTGSMMGLTLSHRRGDILRAGLEGVMLSFVPLLRELRGDGSPFELIRAGGGMFGNAFCRQLLADVVGCRVAMPASQESSGLGAARLGFRALGIAADWPVDLPIQHHPDPSAVEFYARLGELRAQASDCVDTVGHP